MTAGILSDSFEETLTPLLRLKPAFLLRDGIFTPWERAQLRGETHEIVESRRVAKQEDLTHLNQLPSELEWRHHEGPGVLKPSALIENIGAQIAHDITLLPGEMRDNDLSRIRVEGPTDRLFVHPTAQLSPHAVFDTSAGPVVIAGGARIGAFCLVKGPVYVGERTQLDNCQFSNAIAGTECRLGGEIADSIIGNFSNKHHEGFLGHSLLGDWVNLGALTTTSDLKNNYGEVRLTFGTEKFSAGTIKFGSIIGDYAKTAIGTMLGTGSIVDFAANLFGLSHRSGYFRPFLWGETKIYDRNKFLEDAARMMQRRGQVVTPLLERTIRAI